jgi:hypothetical protein
MPARRTALNDTACTHPSSRLFAWFAVEDRLCVGCCACGALLAGAVDGAVAAATTYTTLEKQLHRWRDAQQARRKKKKGAP